MSALDVGDRYRGVEFEPQCKSAAGNMDAKGLHASDNRRTLRVLHRVDSECCWGDPDGHHVFSIHVRYDVECHNGLSVWKQHEGFAVRLESMLLPHAVRSTLNIPVATRSIQCGIGTTHVGDRVDQNTSRVYPEVKR